MQSVLSPVSWVTDAMGVREPIQGYGTKTFHGNDGTSSGSTSGVKIPWTKAGGDWTTGFWVWRQMTPEQWEILDKKPPNGKNGQQAWIENRYMELQQQAIERANTPGSTRSS